MRRVFSLVFCLALGGAPLFRLVSVAGAGQPDFDSEPVLRRPVLNTPRFRSGFSTAAANTVWYGFLASSTDPNKVGAGGKWDFDSPYYASDITGTDSSQF